MQNVNNLDKSLILMINSASVGLACGVVLSIVYAVVNLPDLSGDFLGFGTLAQTLLDHYASARF
jgi:hypothetical protein